MVFPHLVLNVKNNTKHVLRVVAISSSSDEALIHSAAGRQNQNLSSCADVFLCFCVTKCLNLQFVSASASLESQLLVKRSRCSAEAVFGQNQSSLQHLEVQSLKSYPGRVTSEADKVPQWLPGTGVAELSG